MNFSWPDAIAVIGILLAAILGGKLDILPKSLVTALVMAVVGYVGARTLLARRASKWKTKTLDEDGELSRESSDGGGGVVEIAKQQSSRIQIHSDGSVTIGPSPGEEPSPHDDDTPPDTHLPEDKGDKKDDSDAGD